MGMELCAAQTAHLAVAVARHYEHVQVQPLQPLPQPLLVALVATRQQRPAAAAAATLHGSKGQGYARNRVRRQGITGSGVLTLRLQVWLQPVCSAGARPGAPQEPHATARDWPHGAQRINLPTRPAGRWRRLIVCVCVGR